VSAVAALSGSVIGGLTSTSVTWLTQRVQARARRLSHEFSRHEDLYREFIVTASKTYGDAVISSEPQLPELVALYSMISRMRMLSAQRTVDTADRVMLAIIETFNKPKHSVRELTNLIKEGTGIDPLKEFSEAAREELAMFRLA